MKKLSLLCAAIMLFAFKTIDSPISEQERKNAIDLLQKTEQGVIDAVAGLSEAQLARFRALTVEEKRRVILTAM